MKMKLTILLFFFSIGNSFSQDSINLVEGPEDDLKYSKVLLNRNFDFTLNRGKSKGAFNISFFNSTEKPLTIKIYDVIGNLILKEEISSLGKFEKNYDLSFYKSGLFLVEIGNSKYNLTKSIFTI